MLGGMSCRENEHKLRAKYDIDTRPLKAMVVKKTVKKMYSMHSFLILKFYVH